MSLCIQLPRHRPKVLYTTHDSCPALVVVVVVVAGRFPFFSPPYPNPTQTGLLPFPPPHTHQCSRRTHTHTHTHNVTRPAGELLLAPAEREQSAPGADGGAEHAAAASNLAAATVERAAVVRDARVRPRARHTVHPDSAGQRRHAPPLARPQVL